MCRTGIYSCSCNANSNVNDTTTVKTEMISGMITEMTTYYDDRIHRVCDYIYTHLGEDLSVEMLSKVADFSKYHFHRQFSEYIGLSVHKFIQLMRLKRASYQLVFAPHEQVIDIAIDAGFENPESFSRAFKKIFGQTPSQFRREPDWLAWHERYRFHSRTRELSMQITITNFERVKVAVLEHQGAPELLNNSVSKFIDWRKESQLSPRSMASIQW
jgi:AraC family transcriptional regulator